MVDVPPVVYLACLQHAESAEPRALVLGLDDGRRALLAYTSLDRVQRYAGPEQAWAVVRREDLPSVAPHEVVLLDARVPGRDPAPAPRRPAIGPAMYLPVRSDGESVEVRRLKDGRRALLAYTAIDRLAEHCGAAQPWVLVETAGLAEVGERQPFDVVITDMHVPETYRRAGRIA